MGVPEFKDVSGKFYYGALHSQTYSQKRHVVASCKTYGAYFTVYSSVPESAGDYETVYILHAFLEVFFFHVYVYRREFNRVGRTAVLKRFGQGFVRIFQFCVFTGYAYFYGFGLLGGVESARESVPLVEIPVGASQPQQHHYLLVQSLPFKYVRNVVYGRGVRNVYYSLFRHAGKQGYFILYVSRKRFFRPARYYVRIYAYFAQLVDRMLRRFSLQFVGGRKIRH